MPAGFRSGFACIAGRPNVGKSTLLNQILRSRIAITSDRPQTTRNAIRGVLTTDEVQIVFVDTPGLHKPRTTLGERLNEVVRSTLREMDAVLFVLDASAPIGRGDAFLAAILAGVPTPVLCVLNKADAADPAHLAAQTEVAGRLGDWHGCAAVSAKTGDGVPELVATVGGLMPPGPMWYPPEMTTDQPERVLVAELVREQVLRLTHEEVPHSVAVAVADTEERASGVLEIDVVIYVERDSQKPIVIGRRGAMLKEIGSKARPHIEALLGTKVFLRLRVKVEKDWQRRAGMIARFGYGS